MPDKAASRRDSLPAIWLSTDVDDFAAVLAEAVRVLTPGGLLVFYGAHPCFNGPGAATLIRLPSGSVMHDWLRHH